MLGTHRFTQAQLKILAKSQKNIPKKAGNEHLGPGCYDIENPKHEENPNAAFVSRSSRFLKGKEEIPGPGAYSEPLDPWHKPTFNVMFNEALR